jgi:hypothetical protein
VNANLDNDGRAGGFNFVDVYVTNWGPPGPILYRDRPPAIGIFRGVVDGLPVWIAYSVGHVASRRAPAAVFRLEAEGVDAGARWVCVRRRFVELGEAAEV